ncbi:hypothetical protein [Streptomyces kanamyceticus]|uniref:hypothetical protein n=1 Tax=Streptomyces kanamyceticus TaxID=1967 RepID=UPI0037DBF5B7
MPVWALLDAVATVRRLVREAAAQEPQHRCELTTTCWGPPPVPERQYAVPASSAHRTVSLSRPLFLDDTVIEAALTVRLAEQAAVGRYKPLLATEGENSAESYAGLRRHRRVHWPLCARTRGWLT